MECDAFRDDLLDVLYGEADVETAHRFNEHQARCAACREEIASLRGVRHELGGWALAPKRQVSLRFALRPAQWLAAAAGLVAVLGGAVVLARGEIRYPNGQVALRLALPAEDTAELRRLLADQQQRHERDLAALKESFEARPEAAGTPIDQEALLAEVRRIVKASEGRQAAVMAASLGDLEARADAKRRVDLARVSTGLTILEGKTVSQAARTTELMGKVLLASQGGR
jgi:hypothetical protein